MAPSLTPLELPACFFFNPGRPEPPPRSTHCGCHAPRGRAREKRALPCPSRGAVGRRTPWGSGDSSPAVDRPLTHTPRAPAHRAPGTAPDGFGAKGACAVAGPFGGAAGGSLGEGPGGTTDRLAPVPRWQGAARCFTGGLRGCAGHQTEGLRGGDGLVNCTGTGRHDTGGPQRRRTQWSVSATPLRACAPQSYNEEAIGMFCSAKMLRSDQQQL